MINVLLLRKVKIVKTPPGCWEVDIKKQKKGKTMAKWVCSVCGYVHEGDIEPPERCPALGSG